MPLRRPRFKLGITPCAYCSEAISTDREDPIPRALYPPRLRQHIQFLKIPACRPCNDAKAQVDDDLRDFLTINIESQRHPVALELFNDTTIRAVEGNHVRILDQFDKGSTRYDIDPSGSLVEAGYEIPIDDSIIDAVTWLTRGMHWAVFGTSVPIENTKVWLIKPEDALMWVQRFFQLPGRDFFVQGDPYTCGWVTDVQERTFWAHSFFDSVLFLALTQTQGPIERPAM